MDLKWDDRRTHQYITNVGLITSDGPNGPNVMSAEWTHNVSFAPSLMVVCIAPSHSTHKNIKETGEFGINLASVDQSVFSSVAGGSTGTEVDKISVLKELGYEFVEAKHIKPLMVKDAAMSAECKVIKEIELGDHTMFVGEVQEITGDPEIKPMVYHNGKYWHIGEHIEKPPQEKLDKIKELVEKYKKS